jgi:hypothetical protein
MSAFWANSHTGSHCEIRQPGDLGLVDFVHGTKSTSTEVPCSFARVPEECNKSRLPTCLCSWGCFSSSPHIVSFACVKTGLTGGHDSGRRRTRSVASNYVSHHRTGSRGCCTRRRTGSDANLPLSARNHQRGRRRWDHQVWSRGELAPGSQGETVGVSSRTPRDLW